MSDGLLKARHNNVPRTFRCFNEEKAISPRVDLRDHGAFCSLGSAIGSPRMMPGEFSIFGCVVMPVSPPMRMMITVSPSASFLLAADMTPPLTRVMSKSA